MKYYHRFLFCLGMCLIAAFLCASSAFAEEASGNWRPTYDLIMKWINFFILVIIFVKYGKNPIMNFLYGKKDALSREITQIEDEKQKAIERVQVTAKELEESEARFQELKQKIIKQGESHKTEIIDEARRQSLIMFETAKQKLEARIIRAKQKFQAELVDAAIALSLETLPGIVTADDNKKMIRSYIKDVMHIEMEM